MAMGKRRKRRQQLWVETQALAKPPSHPFYEKLEKILAEHGFDALVEERCAPFYAEKKGRPSLPPAVYFRLLLVGYFEGIDSERGIAWRLSDSMALRGFVGYELSDSTPDHSTISRNRRLIDEETHQAVFHGVMRILVKSDLVRGKTVGVDATTLEANAAMRSTVRRDTGESYEKFLEDLAKASGIETPTRNDLARFDRQRKGRKTSNKDWESAQDPDARITKMKDGRTHLAHKVEHAVDMETGALLGLKLHPADRGDTSSLGGTLEEVAMVFESFLDEPEAQAKVREEMLKELVADKEYHSNDVLKSHRKAGWRTYNLGAESWSS